MTLHLKEADWELRWWPLIVATCYSHWGSYQNFRESTPNQSERNCRGWGPGELNRQPGRPCRRKPGAWRHGLGARGWVTLGLRVSRCRQPEQKVSHSSHGFREQSDPHHQGPQGGGGSRTLPPRVGQSRARNTPASILQPQARCPGVSPKANISIKNKIKDPPLNSFLRKCWKLCRPLGSRISSLKLKAQRSTRILVGMSTLQGHRV